MRRDARLVAPGVSDVENAIRSTFASGPVPTSAQYRKSSANRLVEVVEALASEIRSFGRDEDPGHLCSVSALITLAVWADSSSTVLPEAGTEATCRYLLHLAERIAGMNGLPFDVDPNEWMLQVVTLRIAAPQGSDSEPDTSGASRRSFQQWIEDLLGRRHHDDSDQLLNVFVGLPLTNIPSREEHDEATALGAIAGSVACDNGGTVEGRQPAFAFAGQPPSVIARIDHTGLVTADVVIILLTRAASGLGVVLSLSVAAGALVAVLAPRGTEVSPLIEGHPGNIEMIRYNKPEDVESLLNDFFRRRRADAWRQRAHRLARPKRWAVPYSQVVQYVRRRGPIGRSKMWPPDQVEQALQSVDHFAAAPSDLTEDLISAATGAQVVDRQGRPLELDEIRAAFSLVGRLPKERVAVLLAEAGRLLAVGESRARFTTSLWLQLDRELS